jgi:hypothetical protein
VSQIDQAIVVASGRLGDLKLRVVEVEPTVKIEFVGNLDGGIDIGVVKLGTAVTSGKTIEIPTADAVLEISGSRRSSSRFCRKIHQSDYKHN